MSPDPPAAGFSGLPEEPEDDSDPPVELLPDVVLVFEPAPLFEDSRLSVR